MALVCPSCTALNPADAQFCHDCGISLTQEPAASEPPGYDQQPQTPSQTCPRCRTVNEPGSAYCYSCGLPLDEEPDAYHGPAPYTQPLGGHPYQSPRTRAKWTVGLLVATCITYALHIRATFNALDPVERWGLGPYDALQSVDFMSVLLLLVYIPTVVAFLMWIYRTARNLAPLESWGQRFSPAWVVGWWFVPIMGFFRPYQVMAEIWRGSDPEMPPGVEWKTGAASRLLG